MPYKLGKLSPKWSDKTLLLDGYLKASAPPPPPSKSFYEYKIPATGWGMMKNATFGCCTCACAGHEVMNRSAHSGTVVTPTDAEILSMYGTICPGFNPTTDANDNGAAITDALNYMLTTGLAGHKIDGWAQIDQTDIGTVKQGIYLFGSVNIGVQLPNSAMDQTNAGQAWTVLDDDGGIDGGHCVAVMGYGAEGATCVTWGQLQQLSWEWFSKYCDEAYAEIAMDWVKANGEAVNSLDYTTLQADLAAIKA
jgi:hypothetical protein